MSKFNWFFTQHGALDQHTKHFTTSDGNVTYTARTGRSVDNFEVDRVLRVTTGDGYNLAISLPDGVSYGQQFLVLFEVEGGTDTVDITPTTGDSGTQLTAAGGYNHFEWHGSTLGWALVDSSAT